MQDSIVPQHVSTHEEFCTCVPPKQWLGQMRSPKQMSPNTSAGTPGDASLIAFCLVMPANTLTERAQQLQAPMHMSRNYPGTCMPPDTRQQSPPAPARPQASINHWLLACIPHSTHTQPLSLPERQGARSGTLPASCRSQRAANLCPGLLVTGQAHGQRGAAASLRDRALTPRTRFSARRVRHVAAHATPFGLRRQDRRTPQLWPDGRDDHQCGS